jgi:hypothetical protein
LSCERAHIPELGLSGSDGLWPSPTVVVVIVDIKVVARRGCIPHVSDGCDYEKLVTRRHRREQLARRRAFFEPYAIDGQIGQRRGMHRECQTWETDREEKKQ